MSKRETAKERDERIVSEAGPWACHEHKHNQPCVRTEHPWPFSTREQAKNGDALQLEATQAASRILNRIARKRWGGKP